MLERLRYLTSGESHGQALLCIIEGIPSHLSLRERDINGDLSRRQKGYGRGGRMKIENDRARILSGVRWGKTIGSPVSLLINNKDWENWETVMSPEQAPRNVSLKDSRILPVTRPRPGHADLTGALKYDHRDMRNVLERSSARETAARVAVGAVAKKFLSAFDITIVSYVREIGGVGIDSPDFGKENLDLKKLSALFRKAELSEVRCPDSKAEKEIIDRIKKAMTAGDTLGGVFEVAALGVPAGLGSYSQWDRKLESRLASSVMGIQAIKGVEIGLGFEMARNRGSEVMDEIYFRRGAGHRSLPAGGFYRKTNNAGGVEGGMSNGMPIIVRAAMKPIPTLRSPLSSVDIRSKKRFKAAYERSDTCAVPAASVIGEAVTATVLADAILEKFGGDSMGEIQRNYKGYLRQMREF